MILASEVKLNEKKNLLMCLTMNLPGEYLDRQGWASAARLAPVLGVTKQAISRWFNTSRNKGILGNLPSNHVNPLLRLTSETGQNTLTLEKLLVFVDLG